MGAPVSLIFWPLGPVNSPKTKAAPASRSSLGEVRQVGTVGVREFLGQGRELPPIDEPHAVGDLLGTRDHKSLPLLDCVDELGGL